MMESEIVHCLHKFAMEKVGGRAEADCCCGFILVALCEW